MKNGRKVEIKNRPSTALLNKLLEAKRSMYRKPSKDEDLYGTPRSAVQKRLGGKKPRDFDEG